MKSDKLITCFSNSTRITINGRKSSTFLYFTTSNKNHCLFWVLKHFVCSGEKLNLFIRIPSLKIKITSFH